MVIEFSYVQFSTFFVVAEYSLFTYRSDLFPQTEVNIGYAQFLGQVTRWEGREDQVRTLPVSVSSRTSPAICLSHSHGSFFLY